MLNQNGEYSCTLSPPVEQLKLGTEFHESVARHNRTAMEFARRIGGLLAGVPEDPSWRTRIEASWTYQVSCFMYCIVGGVLLLRPEPLERRLELYPWRLMGLSVHFNGFCSYMADTVTWGRSNSIWKTIDVVFASTNTLLQIVIVILCLMGMATFPLIPVACLTTGIVTGIFFKHRGAEAQRMHDCSAFIHWHTLWHISIPLGALIAQISLYERCDWSANCPCKP